MRSEGELRARLAKGGGRLIVHEYVPGEELGVFYYRLPGDGRGRIFGTTTKRRPVVTGDGRRSLADLILDDPRLRCQRRVFARSLGSGLDRVPDDIRGPTMAEIRAVPALPALRARWAPRASRSSRTMPVARA